MKRCWCGCGLPTTPRRRYRNHHNLRKLTADDLAEIRSSRAPCRVLAGLYDVAPQTISNVRHGVFYGDVVAALDQAEASAAAREQEGASV